MSSVSKPTETVLSLLAHDQYFRELNRIAHVSSDEEACYTAQVLRGYEERHKPVPDARVLALAHEARDRLVVGHQRVIVSIAHRLHHTFRSMEVLDLINEASKALLEKWDYYCAEPIWRERPFSHFVSYVVYKGLFAALRKRDRMIPLPQEVLTVLNRKRVMVRAWEGARGCEPTADELVQQLGVSFAVLHDVLVYESYLRIESMQALLERSAETDPEALFVPLSHQKGESQDEEASQRECARVLRQAIETVLTPVERMVIMARYRLDDGGSGVRSYTQLAELLPLSSSHIKQANSRALEKLRDALEYRVERNQGWCRLDKDYETPCYNEREAARALGLSATTFRRRVHAGRIPYVVRTAVGPQRWYPQVVIEELAACGTLAVAS